MQVNIGLEVNDDYTSKGMSILYFLNDQTTHDRSNQYTDFHLQKRDGVLGWMGFGTLRRNPNVLMMGELGYGDVGRWYEETIHSASHGNDYSRDEKLIHFFCSETVDTSPGDTM